MLAVEAVLLGLLILWALWAVLFAAGVSSSMLDRVWEGLMAASIVFGAFLVLVQAAVLARLGSWLQHLLDTWGW